MRKWFQIFLLAVIAPCILAQDQYVSTGGSPYADIVRGAAWGTVSFNRVFLFTPLTPDQRFCLFVANNNPTNSHTFSLAVYQTGDRQLANYSSSPGRWIQDTVQGTPSPVAAASMTSAYVHANAGAEIALVLSGSAAAGGSPDTADVFLVQTTADSCGPVNPSTSQGYSLSTANTGTSAAPPIMAVSDGLSQAYAVTNSVTNPTLNEELLGMTASATKTAYLDKLVISSSVTSTFTVYLFTTPGSGCSSLASYTGNLKVGGSGPSLTLNYNCSTLPSGVLIILNAVPLGAGVPAIIDLKGVIIPPTSGYGIYFGNGAAFSGTSSATVFWYEK